MVELVNALLLSAINLSCEAQTVGVSMQPLLYIALQVTKQYEVVKAFNPPTFERLFTSLQYLT
jgi:hypothetical protein